jgi:hypothetical protein
MLVFAKKHQQQSVRLKPSFRDDPTRTIGVVRGRGQSHGQAYAAEAVAGAAGDVVTFLSDPGSGSADKWDSVISRGSWRS